VEQHTISVHLSGNGPSAPGGAIVVDVRSPSVPSRAIVTSEGSPNSSGIPAAPVMDVDDQNTGVCQVIEHIYHSTPGTISVPLGEVVNISKRHADGTAFVTVLSNGRTGRVPQRCLGPIGKLDIVPPAVGGSPAPKRANNAGRNNYGAAAAVGAGVAVGGAAAVNRAPYGRSVRQVDDDNDFCAEFQKDPLPVKICKILCIPIVLPLWCIWQCIICRPCVWLCNFVYLYPLHVLHL
jgi:hypothetical protein